VFAFSRKMCAIPVWLAAFLWLGMAGAHAQEIQLFLKNGSYQLVKSYQVNGDRVRFYSLDQQEWEEIPASLVDFDATRRAQQEEAGAHTANLERAKEIQQEHHDVTAVNTGFEVAPNLHLPDTEGVYAYDGMRLIPLIQSQGEISTDKERKVLTMALPAPLLKQRGLVALPGAQAAVRIAVPQPVFYIQASDGWGAKAELIPVKSSRSSRTVEKVQSGLGLGQSGESREAVPLKITEVAKGVFKLQPAQALSPGEYAIGELIDGKLNLDVWDFGVDAPGKGGKQEAAAGTAPMTEQRPGAPPRTQPADVILKRHPTDTGPPLPGQGSTPATPRPGPAPPSAQDPSAPPR
jgi:hypothetical protein